MEGFIDLLNNNYEIIILVGLAALAIWGKIGFSKVGKLAKESKEVVDVIKKSLADGQISPEEIGEILKEAKDVVKVFTEKETDGK